MFDLALLASGQSTPTKTFSYPNVPDTIRVSWPSFTGAEGQSRLGAFSRHGMTTILPSGTPYPSKQLTFVNPAKSLVFQKDITIESNNVPFKGIAVFGNHIYAALPSSNLSFFTYFCKMQMDGTMVWVKKWDNVAASEGFYSQGVSDLSTDIGIAAGPLGFVIAGIQEKTASPGYDYDVTMLTLFDSNGVHKWSKKFTTPLTGASLVSVKMTSRGIYVLQGIAGVTLVSKISGSGSRVWTRSLTMGTSSGMQGFRPLNFELWQDRVYVVCAVSGSRDYTGVPPNDWPNHLQGPGFGLIALNEGNGSFIYAKEYYKNIQSNTLGLSLSVSEIGVNIMVLRGLGNPSSSTYDPIVVDVVNLNYDGTTINWAKNFTKSGKSIYPATIEAFDNGMAVMLGQVDAVFSASTNPSTHHTLVIAADGTQANGTTSPFASGVTIYDRTNTFSPESFTLTALSPTITNPSYVWATSGTPTLTIDNTW